MSLISQTQTIKKRLVGDWLLFWLLLRTRNEQMCTKVNTECVKCNSIIRYFSHNVRTVRVRYSGRERTVASCRNPLITVHRV